MKKIYDISKTVTSLAEVIEYSLSGYNPGTSRVPISVTELEEKSISLGDLVADLIDMLKDKRYDN
ncbi:MAG: hypothetical protein J7K40_01135 [candidate division Zixibacteria bacterium]|nr:hypothetical protein [candidate division Zixibacteria bacterium]